MLLICTGIYAIYVRGFRFSKAAQREGAAKSLGLKSLTGKKFVGFFHPYWWVNRPEKPHGAMSDSTA